MRKSRFDGSSNAEYVSITNLMEAYGLGRKPITRLAQESGSLFRVGSWFRIDRKAFDTYFRKTCKVEE